MFVAIDGDNEYPDKDANFPIAAYFIMFLFFGSAFLLNLFTGVLFFRFVKAKQEEENPYGFKLNPE